MRVSILALTPLARDARVLRTAQALSDAGHAVTVIGRMPAPRSSAFTCVTLPSESSPARQRTELLLCQAPATLLPPLAHALYWLGADRREMLRRAVETKPDVVVCNDWLTLPIGAALKRSRGCLLVYDSHEYAAREYIQNWKWRLISRAAVMTLERRGIASADLVLTVSEGIAEGLQGDYCLATPPTVIRNVPPFTLAAPRPANARRRVLFHGLIRPERGLEELIDSAREWTFDGDIVVRGYGSSRYIAGLEERARAIRPNLLVVEAAVEPEELVRRAAFADIGYLALPSVTEHYEFALPNKLFEYLMAGLPVLATPRREIRRVLEDTRSGVLTALSPEAIARTLNGLCENDLETMRAAALAAARSLNWEAERLKLIEAIARLGASVTAKARARSNP